MSDTSLKYQVVAPHDAGGVKRAFLVLECQDGCSIPLVDGEPRMASKIWGWDGKMESPTVRPSIACVKCGFHKTLMNGDWS